MSALDLLVIALLVLGAFFFLAGTAGLLRFPDTLSRLHALTKADNLGLGFIVLALAFDATSIFVGLKLIGIWLLVLVASSSACYLIADYVRESEAAPAPDAQERR